MKSLASRCRHTLWGYATFDFALPFLGAAPTREWSTDVSAWR